MKIKAVCEHTGLSDRAVRLYIDSGLLSPDKTENYAGRRSFDFSQEDMSQLNRIAALRAAGFSIAQIKEVQTDPQSIPRIVAEVTEKQEKELQHIEKALTALTALKEDIASFEELADELTVEEQPTPPAEDSRVRLHYLIAGFFEGAYRNGVLDGIIRAAIMAGLALLGNYVKFDGGKYTKFPVGMWFDVLTVVIAAMAAVASAVLLVRNKDIINSIVKLFFSNLTLAAAIGTMFLIWLIARIILYPARPIPNETTVHIAELWIGFIGVLAVARITFLFCTILHKKSPAVKCQDRKSRKMGIKTPFQRKKRNSHLNPGLKKFFQQGISLVKVLRTLKYTGDCLSAVERPTAQIYGQLKRGRVCVDTCLPLCI